MTASSRKELSRPKSWRHAVIDFVASVFADKDPDDGINGSNGSNGGHGWQGIALTRPQAGLAIGLAYEVDGQICTPTAPVRLNPAYPVLAYPVALGLPAEDAGRARWQVLNADALPAGLALDRVTGALCGTPQAAGAFTLHIRFSLSGYLGSIEAQFEFYA